MAGVSTSFSVAMQKTLAETQKLIVKTAKTEHAKVYHGSPRPASFERFVDGRKGAVEETVKATGVILYTYSYLDLVAQFAMETLYRLSPVLSGTYRLSHTLFLNNLAVANLKGFKSGDEVTISNPVPYARKIEVGRMTMSVPGHVYERTARIVRSRYGNIANIGFTYRGFVGGAVLVGRAGNKAALRYPVIIISER